MHDFLGVAFSALPGVNAGGGAPQDRLLTLNMNGNGSTVPDTDTVLPDEVHDQLWERIFVRLDRGDALITTNDYQLALESEYAAVTGSDASDTLKELFRQAIQSFNDEHPDRLVARGVQNSVTRAFQSGVFKLDWDQELIEQVGESSIERFKTRDRILGFLSDVRVDPALIDSRRCVDHAIEVVNGNKPIIESHSPAEPLPADMAPPPPVSEEAQEALQEGTVSQHEVDERSAQQNQAKAEITQRERANAHRHVDSYVRQGFITSEEGEAVRALSDIDKRVERGEIDHSEGERLRSSLLGRKAREEIERKLAGATDYAVRFVQSFEAMKRIQPSNDEALRFLIFNKAILEEGKGLEAMDRAVTDLASDSELLHEVIDIMDRNDQEVRMISVGLPPYSYIVKRGNERIGNLTIEEDFVDQLREKSSEDISAVLNSEDAATRVRPAADMRCLIAIINHLIKPTPWRKEIRMLKVQLTIEEFFHATDDMEEARSQAESFLQRRLRRVFKDLTNEERAAIEERGSAIIDSIEQQVIAERQEAGTSEESVESVAHAGDDELAEADDLSEDEKSKGALIGRVEVRVAGQMRRIPYKIIRNPDDEESYVIAQRDRDSGELEPVVRRGAKRIVQKGRDGIWRPE